MVNYSRMEEKILNISHNPLPVKNSRPGLIFLLFMALLTAALSGQTFAMDKVAVLPFKIETKEPAENLSTSLQETFSKYMSLEGYESISSEFINSRLSDNVSFLDPEEEIIPLGKAGNADWIILGEITEEDESVQLSVRALDPDSAKTPFSVNMVEKDRNNLPLALQKIAESLSDQIKNNILISEIKVNGSKRASEDAIRNIISSQKGDQFDQEKLDRDLRTIYRMGFFDDVNYDYSDGPEGRTVTFNLTEKPTIINITFEGNERKKEEKLREELGMKKYAVLNRNEVRQSINRLLEYYRNDGYYEVEIKGQIKNLEDENEVILNYVIDEGEKVYIENIEFRGNKVFESDELKDLMLTKEKGWLTWFTDSGVLDKKKLELHDLQKIRIYYDNHGYINAQVGEPEITYNEEVGGLTVTINIVEGNQFMINDIIIEGDLLIPADKLKAFLNVKIGGPFSRQIIHTEKQNIVDFYSDMGYANAEVIPSTNSVEGADLVDVVLTIKKNKRVRIERINISGNEITKDKVFRRELKIVEGDYFSGINLERSKERLDRVDIFENHEVKIRPGSSDDLMVIDIEGEERLRRSISFSAGYGGYEKFMFMLQYANNNLLGRGQNFSLDAMIGGTTTRFNATLTEPWLFDLPVRGTARVFDWDMDYDDYTKKSTGFAGGLAFLLGLDDYTRGTTSYRWEKSEVTDSYTSLIQEAKYTSSSITVGIERNSKNRWWNPTKGSLNYFTFEYAGGFLGGDVAFNKYEFSSTFYLPMKWGSVFVINTDLGLVHDRSGGALPPYEKFYLGGIDSVRGYEWGSVSPIYDNAFTELGGTRKWLYKLEYRFPLVKGEGMTGLVFFDAGNAFDKDYSWKDGAGASVGFGIRWYSPMGPLRLEYGYKLKDNPRDTDSGRFEFTISGSY